MNSWNAWDVAILAVAGYIAVTALARLMVVRRNTLARELRAEIEAEAHRQAQAQPAGQPAAAPSARLAGVRPAAGASQPGGAGGTAANGAARAA